MSDSKPNLVALIKLEFYKKQKNWLFAPQAISKKVAEPAPDQNSKILDKTYSVDTEDAQEGSRMLNDAFLDSGDNTSPDDAQCTPTVLKATCSDSDIWSEIDKKEFRSQDTFSPTKHIYSTQENIDKGLDINFNEPIPNRNHVNLNREFIEIIDEKFVGIQRNDNLEVNDLKTQETCKCEYSHSYRLRKLLENAQICEQIELENMKRQPPQTTEDMKHNGNMQMAEFIFRPQDFPNLPRKQTLDELMDTLEKTEWVDSYEELDPNVGGWPNQSQQLPRNEVNWPKQNQQNSNINLPMNNKPLGPNVFHWPIQSNQPDPNIINGLMQNKRLGPNVAYWPMQNNHLGPNIGNGSIQNHQPGPNIANGIIQNNQPGPNILNWPIPNKRSGLNIGNWPMQSKELNLNARDSPMESKQLEPSGGWPKQSQVWTSSVEGQMLEDGVKIPRQDAMDCPDGMAEEQQWCDSERLLDEAVWWLQRERREIQDGTEGAAQNDTSGSTDSATFMRGAAAAPHSSEIDLRASTESLSSLSSRTEIRSLVKRHTDALRTLLTEANSLDHAQMKSSSEITQQKPRNIWTNIAPNYTSYDELPTRDVGPILPNAGLNLPNAGPNLQNASPNLPMAGPNLPAPGLNLPLANVRPNLDNAGPNLPTVRPNLPTAGPNLPAAVLNLSNVRPNLHNAASNLPNARPNLPIARPNLPTAGPNLPRAGLNLSNVRPNLSNARTNLTNGGSNLPNASPKLPNNGANLPNVGTNLPNAGPNLSSVGANSLNVTPTQTPMLSREKTYTTMGLKNDVFLAGSFRDINTFELGATAGRGRGRLARPMRF